MSCNGKCTWFRPWNHACLVTCFSWWCHQMETFSALLALCVGNSQVIGEFPSQRPVTQSFDIFFDLRLNKWLGKQSIRHWLEMPLHSLWRPCNVGIKIPAATWHDMDCYYCDYWKNVMKFGEDIKISMEHSKFPNYGHGFRLDNVLLWFVVSNFYPYPSGLLPLVLCTFIVWLPQW